MISRKGISAIILMLIPLVIPGVPINAYSISEEIHQGLYINKIVYNIITQEDQQVLALQNGEIDLIGQIFNPLYLDMLEQSENIEILNKPRNGYQILNINTAKYPFNITEFRRALAFALDKQRICSEVWFGYATPQDSPIPFGNVFSAEGDIGYTYYDGDNVTGNMLLDHAGFLDVDEDGYREAPNGDDFDVLIEVPNTPDTDIEIGEIIEDTFHTLSIDAQCVPTVFYEYLNRVYHHYDYDAVLFSEEFDTFDIDWFAYDYWSEYADEPYWNFPNWRNATFDSWREQLLQATYLYGPGGLIEAAYEMQKIWIHACPGIVIGQNQFLSAFRTDRFEGFVNSVIDGVPGWWTNYKAHLKDEQGGPYGGILRWSSSLDIDSFNFMVTSSEYSKNVQMELYDSLFKQDPDGNDILWIAESFYANTHEDNPDVPDGHVRFGFNIRHNITWTDNTPLTGEDVVFSLNYYRDSPGNPYGFDLTEMTAAYAPTPYEVIVEFNTDSYWHLHSISYKPIIPKHVFQEIGLDGWNLWNPDPRTESMITSGPFNVSDYVGGEFIELEYNPNYFFMSWNPSEPRPEQVPITTTGNPTPPGTFVFDMPQLSMLDAIITIPSLIVIVIVLYKWREHRNEV
ncbi:MAG: ABC transporter substrate-binding protein [Candidatus Thorarchaeota archaeon]